MLELSDDPWKWPDLTPDELQELARSTQFTASPDAPIYKYFAVRRCTALRDEIEGGSGFAVLAAVRICGTAGLVMPLWLVIEFNKRYTAVLDCRALSWDDPDSFGRPYAKGAHITAMRKERTLRFAVLNEVHSITQREPNTPIDKGLFERVGRPLGLGATLTEEYYYRAKEVLGTVTAKKRKTPGIQKPRS